MKANVNILIFVMDTSASPDYFAKIEFHELTRTLYYVRKTLNSALFSFLIFFLFNIHDSHEATLVYYD